MEIINGERRSGRTVALIYISATSGQPILTPTVQQAALVEAEARKLGVKIPKVRSYQELLHAKRRGCREYPTGRGYITFDEIDRRGGFLIDNADELFEALLSEKLGTRIAAITICAPVTMKERCREKLDEAAEAGEGPGGLRIVEVEDAVGRRARSFDGEAGLAPKTYQRRQNNKWDNCLGSGHGETWMKCRLCGRSYEVQSEQIDKETGEKYCPWCEGYGRQEEK